MTAEAQKYTREQVETLEVAPGAEHENLEGWIPALATEDDLRQALEKAFDYRGDVTLSLKSGQSGEAPQKIEVFIFNRHAGAMLNDSWIQYFSPDAPEKRKLSYAQIVGIEFSGKDRAQGKHWEDWVKKYNEKKAAGETSIALEPETLE
jgi:hypothetical protein